MASATRRRIDRGQSRTLGRARPCVAQRAGPLHRQARLGRVSGPAPAVLPESGQETTPRGIPQAASVFQVDHRLGILRRGRLAPLHQERRVGGAIAGHLRGATGLPLQFRGRLAVGTCCSDIGGGDPGCLLRKRREDDEAERHRHTQRCGTDTRHAMPLHSFIAAYRPACACTSKAQRGPPSIPVAVDSSRHAVRNVPRQRFQDVDSRHTRPSL